MNTLPSPEVTGVLRGRAAAGQRGVTLVELLVTLVLIGFAMLIGASSMLEWSRRERTRSSANEIRTMLTRARAESLTRNRPCVFGIDGATGLVQVIDTNDPAVSTDDVVIFQRLLPAQIRFRQPDGSDGITLPALTGSVHGTAFSPDGFALSGGEVVLKDNDSYTRVSLYLAGGTRLERWDGTAWTVN